MGRTLTISTIVFIGSVLWAGINLYLAFILFAVGIIWYAGKSFLRALVQQRHQLGETTCRRQARAGLTDPQGIEQRKAKHLAKEALFSSNRLSNRLTDADATCGDFLANEESGKVAYLRRKREQGKRFS